MTAEYEAALTAAMTVGNGFGVKSTDVLRILAAYNAAHPDTVRFDWLDSMNAALNKHNNTVYRWKLVLSPNVVRLMAGAQAKGFVGDLDLNDANVHGHASCRAAIDEAMEKQ